MKIEDIKKILDKVDESPNKWELDNIIYWDRTTNPKTLVRFLNRINDLRFNEKISKTEEHEYKKLLELLAELDLKECLELLKQDEDEIKDAFIEDLARMSAIQVITMGRVEFETMETACKLSPTDFILCAKRTQDIITSIQGLVIKGETLSSDVAGA